MVICRCLEVELIIIIVPELPGEVGLVLADFGHLAVGSAGVFLVVCLEKAVKKLRGRMFLPICGEDIDHAEGFIGVDDFQAMASGAEGIHVAVSVALLLALALAQGKIDVAAFDAAFDQSLVGVRGELDFHCEESRWTYIERKQSPVFSMNTNVCISMIASKRNAGCVGVFMSLWRLPAAQSLEHPGQQGVHTEHV
jgi:hypothetical protein